MSIKAILIKPVLDAIKGRGFLHRTPRPKRVSGHRQIPVKTLMFCSGRCGDATTFEHLCPACVAEFFDYQKEKYEY